MAKDVREALSGDYDAVVIGSGFGSSVAITMLVEDRKNVLVLERGTWWGNPEGPPVRSGRRVKVDPFDDLGTDARQWWPRPNDAKGVNYMLDSIYKEVDPVKDLLFDWRSKDRDIGPKANRKGLYRLTRLGDANGRVDIVSGNGVGGGSLFYSGVNLRPKPDVLERIGLGYLDDEAFDKAGRWMQSYRGRINKLATTVPVPHRPGTTRDAYRLQTPVEGFGPEYEMPDPALEAHEHHTLDLPRSALLRDARKAAVEEGGELSRQGADAEPWHPLPLSIVEFDPEAWDQDPHTLESSQNVRPASSLVATVDAGAQEIELDTAQHLPVDPSHEVGHEFSLLVSPADGPSEILTVTRVDGTRLSVRRGQWQSTARKLSAGSPVRVLGRSNSDRKNSFCLREGRCMLGCLPSARHTLYKTIQTLVQRRKTQEEEGVPDEQLLGRVQVVPQAKVSHVARAGAAGGRYEVFFDCFLDDEDGERFSKRCDVLFVGAGTLGTTEILLRSRDAVEGASRLPLPASLGEGFSTNGDFFGFAIHVDRYDAKTGEEREFKKRRKANPTVGPINASGFDVEWPGDAAPIHVNVEDAGIPPMFARFVKTIVPGAGRLRTFLKLAKAGVRHLLDLDPFDSSSDPDTEERRQSTYLTERELLSDLFFFNIMAAGPDEPLGTFRLDEDGSGLRLRYSSEQPLHEWPVWDRATRTMQALTAHMSPERVGSSGAENFVPSPFWKDERRVTVVHPLGGCPIGADKAAGAVDDLGRVYDADGAGTLPGLYVVDASVLPGALGVNPTLTLVAQAVRTVTNAMEEAF